MKKIASLLMVTLLASCQLFNKDGFTITGNAPGVQNGANVVLETQNELGPVAKDTVKVEDGTFKFKGKIKNTDIYFIRIDGVNGMLPFILESGKIVLDIKKDTLRNSTIGGTDNNDLFQQYNNESYAIYKKLMAFQVANQQKMLDAKTKKDMVVINELMNKVNDFQKQLNNVSENFIKTKPNAFLSILLLENFMNYKTMPIEQVKKYFNGFSEELKNSRGGKLIAKEIKKSTENVAVKIGNIVPNFSAPDSNGKITSLKDKMGKITIIDFWASWCMPCRAENPNMVKLYNEFHAKGLEIVAVSLDEKAAEWKKAIQKDQLNWTQLSNLKGWNDPIATQYNVTAIPATFVIDANGKLIAKDLRGDDLRKLIAQNLK